MEEDDDPYLLHKQTLEDAQLCGTRSRGEFSPFLPILLSACHRLRQTQHQVSRA